MSCCLICLEDVPPLNACTPCGHKYHLLCLQQWFHYALTCPACREDCSGSWVVFVAQQKECRTKQEFCAYAEEITSVVQSCKYLRKSSVRQGPWSYSVASAETPPFFTWSWESSLTTR